jgi:hypothetical protein
MKKIILISFGLLLSSIVFAQIDDDDIAIAQSIFGKTKRAVIKNYIQLSDAEHDAFWSLYDQYENERKDICHDWFDLVRKYAEEYHSLDDAKAAYIAKGYLENSEKINKLNRRYFGKFEKMVGGIKTATLFQIEGYLHTAMQANLQSQIPLIGEVEKMMDISANK